MNPELVDAWSRFVPLAQTAVWAAITVACVLAVRPQLIAIAEVIAQRLSGGAELVTPWLSLKGMPAAVRTAEPTGVTSEGTSGAELTPDVEHILTSKAYPAIITDRLYLLHAAQVVRLPTDSRRGLYRVRVWLEGYTGDDIAPVKRVSYRLYENEFRRPVIATEDAEKSFELWLSVYGEFTVIAVVEYHDGRPQVWLSRYLELPGRPQD